MKHGWTSFSLLLFTTYLFFLSNANPFFFQQAYALLLHFSSHLSSFGVEFHSSCCFLDALFFRTCCFMSFFSLSGHSWLIFRYVVQAAFFAFIKLLAAAFYFFVAFGASGCFRLFSLQLLLLLCYSAGFFFLCFLNCASASSGNSSPPLLQLNACSSYRALT